MYERFVNQILACFFLLDLLFVGGPTRLVAAACTACYIGSLSGTSALLCYSRVKLANPIISRSLAISSSIGASSIFDPREANLSQKAPTSSYASMLSSSSSRPQKSVCCISWPKYPGMLSSIIAGGRSFTERAGPWILVPLDTKDCWAYRLPELTASGEGPVLFCYCVDELNGVTSGENIEFAFLRKSC